MTRLFAICTALLLAGFCFGQDEDPFAGGDDTPITDLPEPGAAGVPIAGDGVPGVEAGPEVGVDGAAAPIAPPAPVSPEVAGDSMVFHEDLRQYEFDVTVAAYQAVNDTLSAPSFALANKARGDIHPPTLTRQQVEASIEEEVGRRVQAEFPDTRYEEIKQEAAADYVMWEVGDRVTVMARRGDKMQRFEGILEFVTRTRIKVSTFPIYKEDLGKDYLPKLYRVEHERAVQRQVTRETRIFNDKRNAYGDEQRAELTPRTWYNAGYIRGRNNTWIAREKVFEGLYAKARAKEYEKTFKAKRESVYLDNGWVFDPTLNRWLSPAEQKPAEPVAAVGDPADGGSQTPPEKAGGIFDQLQNLLNKDGGEKPAGDKDEDDLWDDELKPEAPAVDGEDAKKTPTDDDDLFGEE